MFAALAEGASHPAVAAWLALGTAGLAAVVVAMAWNVNARQIRLAEQLAKRQFPIPSGAPPSAGGGGGGAGRRRPRPPPAGPGPRAPPPPFTLRLFLHGWGLVVVAVLIIGFAGALDALGNFTSSDFIALAVPLAALLGVIAVARGAGETGSRPGNGHGGGPRHGPGWAAAVPASGLGAEPAVPH